VERGEHLKVLAHVVLLELLEKRTNSFVVCSFGREGDLLAADLAAQGAEVFTMRNVEEVGVLLREVRSVLHGCLQKTVYSLILRYRLNIHGAAPTSLPRSPIAYRLARAR
jgi:hypothetical protein